jgi:hypothetical protein
MVAASVAHVFAQSTHGVANENGFFPLLGVAYVFTEACAAPRFLAWE